MRRLHPTRPSSVSLKPKTLAAERPFEHRLLVRETGFRPSDLAADVSIQTLYATLAADHTRNELILSDVIQALAVQQLRYK